MSNFVLTLDLKTDRHQENILNKRLEISRNIYNSCLNFLYKRYCAMTQSKQYQKILKMEKGRDRNRKFNDLNKEYGLTEYSLHSYVKPMQKHFKLNIDSFTAQKIATRCFNAFQKLMFHQSKKVYFKKYGEVNSLEGKSNKTGIRFKGDKLVWKGLDIDVIIDKNDTYAQVALVNKIKYCRIVRKYIRGRYKYYIQLILNGIPPMKINKSNGEIKGGIGCGRVGIDIGTQTIAYTSKHEVKLLELAPEVNNIEKEKRILLRKLDRQRRSNNPNNFNKDGTIKKQGNKKVVWNKSKKYAKTQNKLKEMQRKQADVRKQNHNILANRIVNLGDKIFVEKMNYKGLQARVKTTTINAKTGKINKKKRFGKSLANKAPSMFLTILDNKLKWHGEQLYKINTAKVKASQYNHLDDSYIKKGLCERWNYFKYNDKELRIQRDLYSAFLIMNVHDKLESVDRSLCFKEFDSFIRLHNKEIVSIKNSDTKLISSMGI